MAANVREIYLLRLAVLGSGLQRAHDIALLGRGLLQLRDLLLQHGHHVCSLCVLHKRGGFS